MASNPWQNLAHRCGVWCWSTEHQEQCGMLVPCMVYQLQYVGLNVSSFPREHRSVWIKRVFANTYDVRFMQEARTVYQWLRSSYSVRMTNKWFVIFSHIPSKPASSNGGFKHATFCVRLDIEAHCTQINESQCSWAYADHRWYQDSAAFAVLSVCGNYHRSSSNCKYMLDSFWQIFCERLVPGVVVCPSTVAAFTPKHSLQKRNGSASS